MATRKKPIKPTAPGVTADGHLSSGGVTDGASDATSDTPTTTCGPASENVVAEGSAYQEGYDAGFDSGYDAAESAAQSATFVSDEPLVLRRLHALLDPLEPAARAETALSCGGIAAALFREWALQAGSEEPSAALKRIALRGHRGSWTA